ncbi:hypothetical protein Agabi119p4_10911 [Agaricus bisporus var. burnettii]|uniref:Uncharacterized protein n=1 Tax=Agaricus bisporus var. burnettii TaxID=192524 RepID=A0A8H7C1G3_AGABI|nr:hypothetical protein Agabi119p4_10911 [Agaricus bisporus var. burnettii]
MGYQTDKGPPEKLCVFQAVLLYSIPGWIVMGFGCFIIAFYLDLKDIIATKEYQDYSPPPASKRAFLLLLITPLVFFSGFIVLNLLVVVLDPNRPPAILNYHKLYCTPKRHTGLYAGGTAMSIGMLMWTFILVKTGVLLHRHSLNIRGKNEIVYHRFRSVYIRAAAISIAGSLCVGLYIWSYATNNTDNVISSYCLSFPTIIIFCVFGTQEDIIQAWAFWRKRSGENLGEGSFLSISSFSATSSCPSMPAVYSETKIRGNWRRLGYNWNFRSGS